jgi:hypothetical protein
VKFLSQPRLKLTPGSTIGHLVIVAGPSGAGKSTLLARLARGELPADIRAALPQGAEGWPQTNGRRIQWGRSPFASGATCFPGLVLHYDILRPFQTALTSYGDDPALAALHHARVVTVVALSDSGERLADRLAQRPPKHRPRWWVALARFLRRGPRVYDTAAEPDRHAKLVQSYRDPEFLASWWKRWFEFIQQEAKDRIAGVLTVEPTGSGPSDPSYRIAERAVSSSASAQSIRGTIAASERQS